MTPEFRQTLLDRLARAAKAEAGGARGAVASGKTVDLVQLTRDVRSLGFEIVSKDAYAMLVRSAKRTSRAEAALSRIFGLLTHRRFWNDNVWAAREIAKDVLLNDRS